MTQQQLEIIDRLYSFYAINKEEYNILVGNVNQDTCVKCRCSKCTKNERIEIPYTLYSKDGNINYSKHGC